MLFKKKKKKKSSAISRSGCCEVCPEPESQGVPCASCCQEAWRCAVHRGSGSCSLRRVVLSVVSDRLGHERSSSFSRGLLPASFSGGKTGRAPGSGMGRSLRKTGRILGRGSPCGSRLSLLARVLGLGEEGDHHCPWSGLQALGCFALDAGSEALQPLLLGLLKLHGCGGFRPALASLAALGLGPGLLFWLPRPSFVLVSLAVSNIPGSRRLLSKEP